MDERVFEELAKAQGQRQGKEPSGLLDWPEDKKLRETLKSASPISYVHKAVTLPTFLLHGALDPDMPIAGCMEMWQALKAVDCPVELFVGLDFVHADPRFFTDGMLQKVHSFLRDAFTPKRHQRQSYWWIPCK